MFYHYSLNEINNNQDKTNLLNETINFNDKPHMLENIYSYFNNDLFQGFILTLKQSNGQMVETYFKFNYDSILETINEPYQWHLNNICQPNSKKQYFLNQIESIELSTDFDYREMRLNNYANLIDENDRPVLVINFVDNYDKDLIFYIQWFNPEGKLVDESFWNLKSGVYYYGQYVYLYLNRKIELPLNLGTWSLRISFKSFYDKREKYVFYNYIESNDVLINYKFNIMASKKTTENVDLNDLFKFWSLSSICVNEEIDSDMNLCNKDSYWSSFYPDPKSNI